MNKNRVVLSYRESLLRESDVDLLKGPFWLNDTLISFYFEYLESDLFHNVPKLLFVQPEVTQCIKLAPLEEIGVFLDPLLNQSHKDFIFLVLNDNQKINSSGGSHWSLLVFSRPERMIYHYDSSSGSNQDQAFKLSEKLLKYFKISASNRFVEASCLQQTNGYDCGIHVLCNTEQLCAYASKYSTLDGCPKIEREQVMYKRNDILNIIDNLR